jgi:hypothetical protein
LRVGFPIEDPSSAAEKRTVPQKLTSRLEGEALRRRAESGGEARQRAHEHPPVPTGSVRSAAVARRRWINWEGMP